MPAPSHRPLPATELLQRYALGERDFSGVDLSGAKLANSQLSRTDFLDVNF